MLKILLAVTVAAGCCLNTWAAIADTPQPQPQPQSAEPMGPNDALPFPPACWIVPVSCR